MGEKHPGTQLRMEMAALSLLLDLMQCWVWQEGKEKGCW